MEIFRLFGSIFVDNREANDNIDAVDDNAQQTGKSLGAMIGTAAKWGAGIAVGVGGAVAGLFSLATAASDTASDIADMSVRTGISTTRLQELKFASEQAGVNFESLTSAAAKLTKNMGSAEDGGKKAVEAFKALGVSTTDATTGGLRSIDDILPEVLGKLGDMTNETERNALATKLFGGSATELVPLLAQGSDGINELSQKAHDLGLVMSEDTIAAGDTFGDSLDQIKGALGGVATKIGAELMPKFQIFMDWVLAHMPQIQSVIGTAFNVVEKVVFTVINAIKSLTQIFTEHWAIIQPILIGITAGAVTFGIYTVAINAAAWATAAWTSITAVATVVGSAFAAVMAFITSPIGLVVLAIGLLVAAGVLLYKNWDEVSAFLSRTWEAIKNTATTVFKAIGDFLSKIWEGIKSGIQTVWNGIKSFFTTVWDGIKFIFFNLTLAGILIKHWDTIKSTIASVFNGIKDFLSGIWTSIATTTSNVWGGIAKALTGIWDGIVGGVKGSINAIISAINGMIKGLNKIKVNIPSWVEKTTGMSDFGINIPLIPMLAKGTDNFGGGMAIVGEQGPELVEMPRGSKVTPNAQTERMMNGSSPEYIQTNIHIDSKLIATVVSKAQYNDTRDRTRSLGVAYP